MGEESIEIMVKREKQESILSRGGRNKRVVEEDEKREEIKMTSQMAGEGGKEREPIIEKREREREK